MSLHISLNFKLCTTVCGMSSGGFAAHVRIHRCEASAYWCSQVYANQPTLL